MDDHTRFEELISASLDGELTEEGQRALHSHLEICPDCRAYYQALRAVSQAVGRDLPDPPPELKSRIMDAVRAAGPEKKKARILPFPRRYVSLAAVAAVVVLVGLASLRALGGGGDNAVMYSAAAPAMDMRSAEEAVTDAGPEEAAPETEEIFRTMGAVNSAAMTARPVPFTLVTADGTEEPGEDCLPMWLLGEAADAEVPDRAPDYTLVAEDGSVLFALWEEGETLLFREPEGETLLMQDAETVWETLGVRP